MSSARRRPGWLQCTRQVRRLLLLLVAVLLLLLLVVLLLVVLVLLLLLLLLLLLILLTCSPPRPHDGGHAALPLPALPERTRASAGAAGPGGHLRIHI